MKSKISKYLILIILGCFLICFLLPSSVIHATSTQEKQDEPTVVRVGWFDSMFSYYDAVGRRSGYAYDYIQKISAYAGWKVEYIEGTWTELYDMLQRDELDILGSVCETEERKTKMLFSDHAMGTENYYVFVRSDNSEIKENDFSSLNGKIVVAEEKTIQADIFREWQEKNNIDSDFREMSLTYSRQISMLESGEIDALVSTDSFSTYITDCMPVFSIGSNNYRFAINIKRPELKTQMDYAINQILKLNKYYNNDLDRKYMMGSELSRYLSQSDITWLNEHGTIRIGYDTNNAPYSYTNENGDADGFIADFMRITNDIIKNATIDFETKAYDGVDALIDGLIRGEVDIIFPVRMGIFEAEKRGILITDLVGDTEYVLVVRKDTLDKFDFENPNIVAVKKDDINSRGATMTRYPNWVTLEFDDFDSRIKAVVDGTADCMFIDNYKKTLIEDKLRSNALTSISTGITTGVSFAVNPEELQLYSLFNMLCYLIPKTEINSILIKHSYTPSPVTLGDFIKDNYVAVFLFIGMIFVIITALLLQGFRLAKKERLAAEEAEAANYAKTSFLFNMSHDIRTPMNAIMGFRDLLEKNQEDPVLRADYLAKIKESSSILLSIINNVLEMARIEKGTLTLNETAVSTPQLSDLLYSIFNEMMQKKDITFIKTIEYKHPYIYLDMGKTRDIFMNILSNAQKYTAPGGTVTMTTEEINSDKLGYAMIKTTITDTGIGMDEEFLPHLFTEFSREENANSNKIEGTGLGMSIVKRLVDFLGGTIEVTSKKNVGTTFVITLPHRIADKADMDLAQRIDINLEKFKGKHILLAEDNDINAEIAVTILSDLGFIVDRAEDGRICVENYLNTPNKYDLILMDVQMPGMNGYEATQTIRSIEGLKKNRIPILAMTANAFEEDKKAALSAGMDGHLSKPIDIDKLTKEISRVLL